jgi:hypothetical protein
MTSASSEKSKCTCASFGVSRTTCSSSTRSSAPRPSTQSRVVKRDLPDILARERAINAKSTKAYIFGELSMCITASRVSVTAASRRDAKHLKDPQTLEPRAASPSQRIRHDQYFFFVMHGTTSKSLYLQSVRYLHYRLWSAATPHRKPTVVPHTFQLPSLITHPPPHEIPSAPEHPSANLSPSTACATSAVGRRGRTFHPCSQDVSECIRVADMRLCSESLSPSISP